jgi:ABC-2 type transport system permease protein
VRNLRLLGVGWVMHMKMLSTSSFNGLLAIVYPVFFATVAFFIYRAGDRHALAYAGLGAAVMGIWGSTSTAAGAALQRERWHGTLEILVTSPAPFSLVLLPITVAMASIGLYSMFSTLLWGRVLFGIHIPVHDWPLFCLAIVATIASIGMCGFLIAVAFVRYRTAWALGNLLEYPIWMICGFLVPLHEFPGAVQWISRLLAPTWGMRAIRDASNGTPALTDLAVCVGLGAGYVIAGVILVERLLGAARARATLSLT